MKKSEWVYRELAEHALGRQKGAITQLGLSKKLGISLSTVNNALGPLREIGAISVLARRLLVNDTKKLLVYWAGKRRLASDIVYKTRVGLPVGKIEAGMPSGVVFGGYSAYRLMFDDAPADYSQVYVYATEEGLGEIKRRFGEKEGEANLFVLRADERLLELAKNGCVPVSQAYVDLWNLSQWYAHDFVSALEGRFGW